MRRRADTALVYLLRLIGGAEVCAVPFIFFPMGWMDAIHDRGLGLGPLPHGPMVEYLARNLSALYAAHGAMVFALSLDLPRFRPLVVLLGWLHVLFGLIVLGTDASAGLPWYWVAAEGPGIAACGALILALNRGGAKNPAQGA